MVETQTGTQCTGWRAWAECAGLDTEIFYPEPLTAETKAGAKEICGRCAVRFECLADAIATNEGFGIRGGLTARERRTLVRRLRQDANRTAAARRAAGLQPLLVAVDCG
ncbi:MAG: WhiB family transcriptional regulator [Actinobacteria bacterium]|nr:WhiB family transcriptional regulator [Actinomycetota bacterium]